MTADYNHVSYEHQGAIETNIFLLLVVGIMLFITAQNMLDFLKQHESWFSPHLICLVAMGL